MGNPILHRVATKVEEPGSLETAKIVDDMLETLEDSGGIGLAAPQVHISKRIVVFYIPENRAGENDGVENLTVMLNPEIEPLTENQELDWEDGFYIRRMETEVKTRVVLRKENFGHYDLEIRFKTDRFGSWC